MTIPVNPNTDNGYQRVQNELIELVEASRGIVIQRVNALMCATYWEIGRRIVEVEQDGAHRADYLSLIHI